MNKLPLIIKREYLAKVRNKSFVVMTFLSPILMVGMILLIAYLTQLNDNEKKVIAVLNESGFFSNEFVTSQATSYVNFNDITLAQAKDSTSNLGYYGLLYLPSEPNLEQVAQRAFFYSKDAPNTTVLEKLENIITGRLRQERLRELGVSSKEYAEMDRNFTMNIETFDGFQNVKGINEIKAVIGGAFGYLIMMFIIIYGGFVMRSVIEEKTSRIIEVIISSVKPIKLLLGKIFGTSLAGITQFLVWTILIGVLMAVVPAMLGIDPSTVQTPQQQALEQATGGSSDAIFQEVYMEVMNLPLLNLVIMFLFFFIGGYLLYASLYAAIGAAVDSETDTQQFMLPIILPLILAVYVGFFTVLDNPHGTVAQIFSYIPFTSPVVMLMRIPFGVPIWQQILSVVILFATFMGTVWFAAKIYRVGILMYGKKPSYRELIKWLKY